MEMGRILLTLAITLGIGLASRLWPTGWFVIDKSLGDAAYATAAYLALALLRPRWRSALVAAVALGWCVAVECFQATGIPMQYAQIGAVRWLLGTTFAWHDLACYGIGIAVVFAMDARWLRPRSQRVRTPIPC